MFYAEGLLHGESLGPNKQPHFIAFMYFSSDEIIMYGPPLEKMQCMEHARSHNI